MSKSNLLTLHISQESRLQDGELWENRFETVSQSSGSTYIIAQHRTKRFFACSCRAWTTRRKCKHLTAHGLPNEEVPLEVTLVAVASNSKAVAMTSSTQPSSTRKQSATPIEKKPKRAFRFHEE